MANGRSWAVLVNRHPHPVTLGDVYGKDEAEARLVALHKYGMDEDEYFDAINAGVEQPQGISPGDDFSVIAR